LLCTHANLYQFLTIDDLHLRQMRVQRYVYPIRMSNLSCKKP